MGPRSRLATISLLAAAALAGCQEAPSISAGGEVLVAPAGTVSVYELAGHLGLDVTGVTASQATCRDSANTVVIFTDPGGQVFVNGRQVGPTGGIVMVEDVLFLPAGLFEHIRRSLRTSRPPVAPPELPEPARPPEPILRDCVVIDPGHGGKDPGATSCLGFEEKTVNLVVGREVARLLAGEGLRAELTRQGDQHVELNDRPERANAIGAHLFVSIHADSCANPSAQGFTVYVSRSASQTSLAAADAIVRALSAMGIPSRGIGRANYRVLVRTRCPAVLVEMGYLSNHHEARQLSSASFRSRIARAIADGILAYLRRP